MIGSKMFGSIFDSFFGTGQSTQSKASIKQLYELNASFQAALLEELQNSEILSEDQVDKILKRRNNLIGELKKTRLEDEWEDYGYSGKDEKPTKQKVSEDTKNTWDAIFALINNQWDRFKDLIKEGPSTEDVKKHEAYKADRLKKRQDYLDHQAKKREKQANCTHKWGSGFFSPGICTLCGLERKSK